MRIYVLSVLKAPVIALAVFARERRRQQLESTQGASKHTYIPLQFSSGEAFQFDWSEDWAVIAGERVKLQVAHCKLSYSRAFFVRAYPLQTHEMLFNAHYHAFTAWGGIPQRGIYDNMKTAVDKVKRGKQRDVNARFAAMVSHYLFDAEFCNPAAGWEKGQIEKNVQDARRRLWQKVPALPSLTGWRHVVSRSGMNQPILLKPEQFRPRLMMNVLS